MNEMIIYLYFFIFRDHTAMAEESAFILGGRCREFGVSAVCQQTTIYQPIRTTVCDKTSVLIIHVHDLHTAVRIASRDVSKVIAKRIRRSMVN